MVQTRSMVKASTEHGKGAAKAVGKLPNEFFYELLTSLDWTYGELGMLKRVSKGWKGSSPKLDAALFREQPSASPNDPKIERKLHPMLENIDDILVTSLNQVTIAGSGNSTHRAVDLVKAMSQQALSPSSTSIAMINDGDVATLTRPAGVTVADFLAFELDELDQPKMCEGCGEHHPGMTERAFINEGEGYIRGYKIEKHAKRVAIKRLVEWE